MQYLASDISLEGFSKVAGSTGDITDSDNLLVALAKLQNRTASATPTSAFARVPAQKGRLIYDGTLQEPEWSGYDANHVRRLSGSELKATDAGTYTVIFSLLDGVSWEDDGTIGDRMIQWTIEKAVINQLPSQSNTLTYDGTDQYPTWSNYDSTQLLMSGMIGGNDAKEYTAIFTPKKNFTWSDGSASSKEITWTIQKAIINEIPSAPNAMPYDGSSKSPSWQNYNPEQLTINGNISAVDVGSYAVNFTPKENFVWKDGSSDAKTVMWTIESTEKTVVKIPSLAHELIYNGVEQSPIWTNIDENHVTISGSKSAKDAGTYTTIFTLGKNCIWTDGTTETKLITWKIQKATIAIPTVTDTFFEYDAQDHGPSISSFDEKLIAVTGNTEQKEAGDYTIILRLKDSSNWQWADGTAADKTYSWAIRAFNRIVFNTMRFGTDVFVLAND